MALMATVRHFRSEAPRCVNGAGHDDDVGHDAMGHAHPARRHVSTQLVPLPLLYNNNNHARMLVHNGARGAAWST